MYRVLLADDHKMMVSYLNRALRGAGYEVVSSSSGEEALRLFAENAFDLVVTDVRMDPVDGVAVLREVRQRNAGVPVILMSGAQDVAVAAASLKEGAFDYVQKPFNVPELLAVMKRALAYTQAQRGILDLGLLVGAHRHYGGLVAESPSMSELCGVIQRIAPTDATVLVYGETGTGRTLVAQTVHEMSLRRERPWVPVDCSAPESATSDATDAALGRAGGGTLFLQNVDRLAEDTRSRVLAVFRPGGEKEAAADRPRLVASAGPDADFAQRFATSFGAALVEVAPLRRRAADILPLTYDLLCAALGGNEIPFLDVPVSRIFEHYDWPGNIAELEGMIREIVGRGKTDRIRKEDLPAAMVEKAESVASATGVNLQVEFLVGDELKRYVGGKVEEDVRRLREGS